MTYDTKDGYVLLYGGVNKTGYLNDTWKFSAGTWALLHPKITPPKSLGAMTYDAKDGYVVLLVVNQTWKFSGGVWTQLVPDRSPPVRYASAMTYDAKDGYVLLFGGYASSGSSGYLGDTWRFVGGQWTNITTSAHPKARAFSVMTYDTKDGYVVLFGGCDVGSPCSTGGFLSDTWKFVDGKWTKLTISAHPSARGGMAMTYDVADGYVVLFGGCDTTNCSHPYSDTWKFVGGSWTHLTSLTHPGPRLFASMTFDTKDGQVVLFGGSGPSFKYLGDTWKYLAGSWTKV